MCKRKEDKKWSKIIIMNGCNGHMGQVISRLVAEDKETEIVAGIDLADKGIIHIRYSQRFQPAMYRQM